MRRLHAVAASAGLLVSAVVASAPASAGGPKPPSGFWIAGDLHVHTIYGHDTCLDPSTAWNYDHTGWRPGVVPDRSARRTCSDPYVVGFTPADRLQEAKHRGLGFVALTDHNNVVNQSDPAVLAWMESHPDFVVVPGYENSQPGHVQMLGARSCYSPAGAITDGTWRQWTECDGEVTEDQRTVTGESALRDALRADGGVFQINHPSDHSWLNRFGYSVVPDTVEVWNEPWWYQSPAPASNDDDFALQWYDGFLQRGYQVGVTGGSDSHWVTTDSVQGIGDPTTWVFVRDRSVQAVLDGLRAHRTFVSMLPPAEGGPQLFLEADRSGDGTYDEVAGSTVSPRSAFRVRTTGALPGSVLRIVTDATTVEVPLPASGSYAFRLGDAGISGSKYVRAELVGPDQRTARQQSCDPILGGQTTVCRDNLLMEAITSPLFLESAAS